MNPPNKLSPAVQALIALALLVMFAGVLFVPAFSTTFKVEADTKQTLFTLVTAVVFFSAIRHAFGRRALLHDRQHPGDAAASRRHLPVVLELTRGELEAHVE